MLRSPISAYGARSSCGTVIHQRPSALTFPVHQSAYSQIGTGCEQASDWSLPITWLGQRARRHAAESGHTDDSRIQTDCATGREREEKGRRKRPRKFDKKKTNEKLTEGVSRHKGSALKGRREKCGDQGESHGKGYDEKRSKSGRMQADDARLWKMAKAAFPVRVSAGV